MYLGNGIPRVLPSPLVASQCGPQIPSRNAQRGWVQLDSLRSVTWQWMTIDIYPPAPPHDIAVVSTLASLLGLAFFSLTLFLLCQIFVQIKPQPGLTVGLGGEKSKKEEDCGPDLKDLRFNIIRLVLFVE